MHRINPLGWMLLGVLLAWVGWQVVSSPVYGQNESGTYRAAGEVIAIKLNTGPSSERLVLIDPSQRTMATYRVIPESGAIKLESVRPFGYDLQLSSFNVEKPTPEEIRIGLERNAN